MADSRLETRWLRRLSGEPDPADIDAFCASFFGYAKRFLPLDETVEFRDEDWATSVFDEMVRLGAIDDAWRLLLVLVERAPDDEVLGFVGAGPLEDPFRRHGEEFAERIIDAARTRERFRQALEEMWGWEELPERVLVAFHDLGAQAVRSGETKPLFVDSGRSGSGP